MQFCRDKAVPCLRAMKTCRLIYFMRQDSALSLQLMKIQIDYKF